MPELPEVHTTVTGLHKVLTGLTITDVWTDLATGSHTSPHLSTSHKDKNFFVTFKRDVAGAKVISVKRRAKNILINIKTKSGVEKTILIHMKMTGHMMVGKYVLGKQKEKGKKEIEIWAPAPTEKNEALRDPYNRFLHVVFSLSNGKHVVLSDVRKFAKMTLLDTAELPTSIHLKHLGPEPLEKNFNEAHFAERLMKKPRGKIKIVLLDQTVIAGIGNIYSDEMLFLAGIHPFSIVEKIPNKLMAPLYKGMIAVLKKGIDFGGDSTSDYRDITGNRGKFQSAHNVYRRAGKPCPKRGCKGTIEKVPFGGRSAHFCPAHQKLYI
ncbi:MAG: bifunctional DNA-formamidopyrimidine glycosylase/DNA-(apurinic or apyrimidinic site) lyase [Candidatus Pacebacteria bacterium]|nr:bifunctional DNA-formamidopyrimidine glycosylase/DNA-(apurinic or apyrimidinic site) lyase [Candidatus Paceibacterota bacterium]MBP9851980.1 bifunctional DNA-formamidopyrimidine glycosylase/DNA-(apurinic or apyrimidinic site) lyase [Candidatus Paceibacterota bacterium]